MALDRSQQMSRIRGSDTKPELILRKLLWRSGLRYRLHARTPVGRPDIVFPGKKVAVFVDGCFWHGCPDHYVRPRSSEAFWAEKLRTNTQRDIEQTRKLEDLGWKVCRLWEHEVFETPDRVVGLVQSAVNTGPLKTRSSWRVVRVQPLDPEDSSLERRFMCQLRDPGRKRQITRKRTTEKWKIDPKIKQLL